MLKGKLILGIAAIAATLLLMACDDDDEADGGSDATNSVTEEQVCNDLEDLATAVQGLEELDANSTIADAQGALAAVETAWGNVKDSIASSAERESQALATTIETFGDTIANLPESADSLGEAEAQVQAAAGEVANAREEAATAADCG